MSEIVLSFDAEGQALGPLREAAYRLLGVASSHIDLVEGRYVCRLLQAGAGPRDPAAVRGRFLDLVTDENLREKIGRETAPTRNLILALAFGALAEQERAESP